MSLSQKHRASVVLGATVLAAAALPIAGAGTAHAADAACESATVQYRTAEAEWTSQGGFHQWDDAPSSVEVRLAPDQTVADGCKYPVSLAAYTTEGPDWSSSGHQTLLDQATVYLTAEDVADKASKEDTERSWQTLSVKLPDCFGQIDLYGNDTIYDGKDEEGHGPAPYQPGNIVTPHNLIAAWNGGDQPCADSETPTPTATPSEPTPSAPTTPAGTEQPETTPPATPTTPETATTPPTSADVSPVAPEPSTPPEPSPQGSEEPLAETGSSAPAGLIAGGAALVIALGAGTIYATGRTRRQQS